MADHPFAHFVPSPLEHFKLYFYAGVLKVLEQVFQILGTREAAFERFPFLAGYNDELAAGGLDGLTSGEACVWWLDALGAWEENAGGHLPLRALRQAAHLDHHAMCLLVSIGLIEEDARFGAVFDALQGTVGQHRPTLNLLQAWYPEDGSDVRASLRLMEELQLVRPVNPTAPRLEWALEVPGALWDALRGERNAAPAPWARYRAPDKLLTLDELILPDEFLARVKPLPALLASGQIQAVIVRGAQHNSRRTLLGALARSLGRGLMEIRATGESQSLRADDERWRIAGPLATALGALPVVVFDLAPQETVEMPRLLAYDGAVGIVLGRQGGVGGEGVERALTLTLALPDAPARCLHWQRACQDTLDDRQAIGHEFRLTAGNIHRAAQIAQSHAALANRATITLADVQQATRALNRQMLDTLAVRLEPFGDWNALAVGGETRQELASLESRCRHREHLHAVVSDILANQLNPGVRALFSGPSGTGKTLAARLLAASLQKDLYRLDLSSVVNKYIGETEKNLSQVFSRAEELDVILLLDEGDALLTQRTSVQTSNDRYANLETNYLLQRLESFEGILIVTTNAGERIDSAFQRRMDVVIAFRPPEVEERWEIWQSHLPPSHAVQPAFLEQVAQRCILSGGQIRNAVLHASLLALDDGGIVNELYLDAAIQREYRKAGGVCPLRSNGVHTANRR